MLLKIHSFLKFIIHFFVNDRGMFIIIHNLSPPPPPEAMLINHLAQVDTASISELAGHHAEELARWAVKLVDSCLLHWATLGIRERVIKVHSSYTLHLLSYHLIASYIHLSSIIYLLSLSIYTLWMLAFCKLSTA